MMSANLRTKSDTCAIKHHSLPTYDQISTSDRESLLDLWRALVGPPQKNLSLPFLRDAIAFELQLRNGSEAPATTLADLERIARGGTARAAAAGALKPGSSLLREWQGRSYRVDVTEQGLFMDGAHYPSLSAIAKHITGTHWSGPRFFGLAKHPNGKDV